MEEGFSKDLANLDCHTLFGLGAKLGGLNEGDRSLNSDPLSFDPCTFKTSIKDM